MAINRKDKKVIQSFPSEFLEIVQNGMTANVLKGHFDDEAKGFKVELGKYLEETDEVEMDLSKAVKTEFGNVTMKVRSNVGVDKEVLKEMFEEGIITIDTILSIASITAAKAKTALGEANFKKVAVDKPDTEFLELKPNKEFKEEVIEIFMSSESKKEDASETVVVEEESVKEEVEAPKPVKKPAKKKAPVKKTVKKSLAKRAKTVIEELDSVDDEIDSILASAKRVQDAKKK